jgi:hypothetical protein
VDLFQLFQFFADFITDLISLRLDSPTSLSNQKKIKLFIIMSHYALKSIGIWDTDSASREQYGSDSNTWLAFPMYEIFYI